MKKQLLKKLASLFVTSILFSASTNAQIIYTDVIPDTILPVAGNYNLDLNNDGQNDFTFFSDKDTLRCGPGGCFGLVATLTISPTVLSWVSDSINVQARKLNSGDSINSSSPLWSNTPNQAMYIKAGSCGGQCFGRFGQAFLNGITAGLWNNATDKYLPLKIEVSGSVYFGWARLDVGNNGFPITIKDYAYNSIPNQTILAGQTIATGIGESKFLSSIDLYPNPTSSIVTIDLGSKYKKAGITISDITGKIVYVIIANEINKVEVNIIDFAEGIYVVQIQIEESIATKKLIVRK